MVHTDDWSNVLIPPLLLFSPLFFSSFNVLDFLNGIVSSRRIFQRLIPILDLHESGPYPVQTKYHVEKEYLFSDFRAFI
jgi:hypothetical protein